MALKPGAGKKLLLIAAIGGAIGFGVVKYTGASTKVQKTTVDSSKYALPDSLDAAETDSDGYIEPAEPKVAAPTHPVRPSAPVAKRKPAAVKPVAKPAEATKPAPPKPVKKKTGERENLDLSNF